RAPDQLDFLAELLNYAAEQLIQARVVQALDHFAGLHPLTGGGTEQMDIVVVKMKDALEALAHTDRPSYWRTADFEHILDLIEQLHRLPAFAIELVDEGHDRGGAHAADVHQLDG